MKKFVFIRQLNNLINEPLEFSSFKNYVDLKQSVSWGATVLQYCFLETQIKGDFRLDYRFALNSFKELQHKDIYLVFEHLTTQGKTEKAKKNIELWSIIELGVIIGQLSLLM